MDMKRLQEVARRVTCDEVHEGTLCAPCRADGVGCLRAWVLDGEWPNEAGSSIGEWQPIETAPRDETLVLLYPSRHWSEDAYPCDAEVGYWDMHAEAWLTSCAGGADDYTGPTHWMPLPDHPSIAVDGGRIKSSKAAVPSKSKGQIS